MRFVAPEDISVTLILIDVRVLSLMWVHYRCLGVKRPHRIPLLPLQLASCLRSPYLLPENTAGIVELRCNGSNGASAVSTVI